MGLADAEGRDEVTAPGLAGSFQVSGGSGWSSLALGERGCIMVSSRLPEFTPDRPGTQTGNHQ